MKKLLVWLLAVASLLSLIAQPIPIATAKLTERGLLLGLPDDQLNRSWILEESTNLPQWHAYFTNGGGFDNHLTITNIAPAHRWFRFRPFEGAPVMVWGPNLIPDTTSTYIQAAVAGSLPMTYQWYRDTLLLTGTDESIGTAPGILLPTFTYHDNGLYRLVAKNSFGSVTSAPVEFYIQPPPDWAPDSIAGRLVEVDVSNATFPFAAPAIYQLKLARTGNTYTIKGLLNVPDSSGTYTYTHDGLDSARLTFSDSITGASSGYLLFTSATGGIFGLNKTIGNGTASGNFGFVQ